MLNINHKDSPDFFDYEEILNEHPYVYMNKEDAEKLRQQFIALQNTAERVLSDYMFVHSQGQHRYFTQADFVKFLVDFKGVSSSFVYVNNGKSSYDKNKVINPVYTQYPHLREILDEYIRYTELKSDVNKLGIIINQRLVETDKVDQFNRPLHRIEFSYLQQDTFRYYTSNDNVQGYSKRFLHLFTVPKDYFLYWADFKQIDFRVMFNIILRNDAPWVKELFANTEDKYEAMARVINKELGKPFNFQEFKDNRQKYKKAVLSRAYGASTHSIAQDIGDREFANMIDQYFLKNEKYQEFVKKINMLVNFTSNVTITEYFGNKRDIPVSGNISRTVHQVLNTPVQATSNSIVVHYTNRAIKIFREMGLGPDKISIYLNRHDEQVFICHKDILPYMYILEAMSNVQVDDWDVLTMDHHLGYFYGKEDSTLTKHFNSNVMVNRNVMPPNLKSVPNTMYSPIKELMIAYTYVTDNKAVIVQMHPNGMTELENIINIDIDSTDPSQVVIYEKLLAESLARKYPDRVQIFNVQTRCLSDATYLAESDTYVNYSNETNGEVSQKMHNIKLLYVI